MSSIQRITQLIKANTYGGGSGISTSQDFNQMGLDFCEHAKLSYTFRIGKNFNLIRGGKLPGLASAGTNEYTGGLLPTGSQGWSMRMMWHKTDDGKYYELNAYPYLYLESVTKITLPATYVDFGGRVMICKTLAGQQSTFEQPKLFLPNRWYKLEQEIKLNTPGVYDGILRLAINGETLVYRDDVSYRTVLNDVTKIGRIMYHIFFGGDASWVQDTIDDYVKIEIADIITTIIA